MPDAHDLSTPLAWALAYAQIGWHVLPLEPGQKQPLGKLVPRGMLDATIDLQIIRSWWMRHPTAGVGVSLAQSGLVAIDIDPRNGGTETFEQLQAEHSSLRSEVMAYTGGGGEHHVFVVPQGHQVSLPGTLGPGVDVKANGYIVVEPSVHPSGKTYGWEGSSSPLDGVVPSPLPDWLRNLRVRASEAPKVGDKPANPQQSKDAREALYCLNADDYHEWIQAGMSLHSTGWGHPAYAMWCAWSQQSDKFDATVCRHKWASFHEPGERVGKPITLSWIFGKAATCGWQNPSSASTVRIGPAAVAHDGLVLSVGELYERASAVRWAVKGLIPERSLGFVYGASGTFKSFLTLDYALHRAYGMKWLGRRTKQAVPVYLAAEGGAGLMRRIEAWHKDRGMVWQDCPMRVVIVPLTLRTQAADLCTAIRATGVMPGDLIVDTMSQTFTGNENSNDEVAEFLRILGTDLRDALQCAVTVVHHSGHSATERPRGASAIVANVDFAFGVFRDEKEMLCTIDFLKIKDGERPDEERFEMARVDLGFDEDGDIITSLAARHLADGAEVQAAMQREAQAGRGGKNNMILELAKSCIKERELRKAFYEDCELVNPEARKKAYQRARHWAVSNNVFEIIDGVIVHPKGK